MVLSVDSVFPVPVLAALPVQNPEQECVCMSISKDGQAWCNAGSMCSLKLAHPEKIRSSPEQKQEDQFLEAISASAALEKALPGLGLGQVILDDISYWLLFAMLSELSLEGTLQNTTQ